MTEPELFIMAEEALTAVVEQIKDDQWDMQMPPEFQRRDKQQPVTLHEAINYHAYDDAWVPDTLAGRTIAEVGDKYDGDLLGADPKASWQAIVAKAVAAVRDFKDLDRLVHLTYGDYPAREYLQHIISFRGLRAVDIARVIDVSERLKPELVQGMWDAFEPQAEEWRKMGVFGPRVEVPTDADLQAKLMGLTGRQP